MSACGASRQDRQHASIISIYQNPMTPTWCTIYYNYTSWKLYMVQVTNFNLPIATDEFQFTRVEWNFNLPAAAIWQTSFNLPGVSIYQQPPSDRQISIYQQFRFTSSRPPIDKFQFTKHGGFQFFCYCTTEFQFTNVVISIYQWPSFKLPEFRCW